MLLDHVSILGILANESFRVKLASLYRALMGTIIDMRLFPVASEVLGIPKASVADVAEAFAWVWYV